MKHISVLLALCLMLLGVPAMAENAQPVSIVLADAGVTVNGAAASADESAAVYVANDIVFYLAGQDFTYGEGTEEDAHEQSEADAHTVVHITQPGTYELSGKLSKGQIAVDLGEDAEEDPTAVVTLILNGVDINCDVAPAVIFYNVYEPFADADKDNAVKDVDTSAAGANVIIADGSTNNVEGSYVARIYKSVELSEDGTEIIDSKKLHKYDGAFYSKMTMNVDGGALGDGVLNIVAENEGLNSEMHLTVNGGNIHITSGNDGINTNEDYVSVFTMNGGTLDILVEGQTGEGDGIDSNGWLVINGGTLTSAAYGFSGDAGIDSDMGIHINGGTVAASGNMLDAIAESNQNYAVFQFASSQKGGSTYTLKDADGNVAGEWTPENNFSYLVVSAENIVPGTYTFWQGETQLAGAKSEMRGMRPMGNMTLPEDMEFPQDGERPELPEDMEFPQDGEPPEMPEDMEFPQDGKRPEKPQGGFGGGRGGNRSGMGQNAELSQEFVIELGGNTFAFVSELAAK